MGIRIVYRTPPMGSTKFHGILLRSHKIELLEVVHNYGVFDSVSEDGIKGHCMTTEYKTCRPIGSKGSGITIKNEYLAEVERPHRTNKKKKK